MPLTTSYTLSLALGSPVEEVPCWATTDQGFYKEDQRCWFVGGYVGLSQTHSLKELGELGGGLVG